jgi:thiol-disulfide isomerase/thioredoxin
MNQSEILRSLDQMDNALTAMRSSVDTYTANVDKIKQLHTLLLTYGSHTEERFTILRRINESLFGDLARNRQEQQSVGQNIEILNNEIRRYDQTIESLTAQIDKLNESATAVQTRTDRQVRNLQELRRLLTASNQSLQETHDNTQRFHNRVKELQVIRNKELDDMQSTMLQHASLTDRMRNLQSEQSELNNMLEAVGTISRTDASRPQIPLARDSRTIDLRPLSGLAAFTEAIATNNLTVVFFWSESCETCADISNGLTELAQGNRDVRFYSVNVEESIDIVAHARMLSMPPVIHFYKSGQRIDQIAGSDLDWDRLVEILLQYK